MKNILKKFIVLVLASYVRRLYHKRQFKVVAVAGSIGKTSTKFAIAQLLGTKYRVLFQSGNYNIDVTVPLVFFGLPMPSIFNPFAWIVTFLRIEINLHRSYPYDVVIVELGTDAPGQMEKFKSFIKADIGVLTSIAPEHMEYFGTIASVAKEELVISELCGTLLLNRDLVEPRYEPQKQNVRSYGINNESYYNFIDVERNSDGFAFTYTRSGQKIWTTKHPSISIPQLYSLCAALSVGNELGMSSDELLVGIEAVTQVNGRMQILKGIEGSIIIDESYNASPEAMKSALKALYDMPGNQKIALLGNMNELGGYSASAHAEIGALCDASRLSSVVTLGPDSNDYLAPAAEKRGCHVKRCKTPYEAAEYIKSILQTEAVILIKGSQNKVYAEETIKQLLADPNDVDKLVRQTKYWMRRKAKSFNV